MAEVQSKALEKLSILGGKLLGEDDIVFQGTRFIIPQHLSLREAGSFIMKRAEDEESEVQFERMFDYRPMDGARATAAAIKKAFGFTMGKTLHSFFGKQLPMFIDVRTGPGPEDVEQVPWGAMQIPALPGSVLHLADGRHKEYGSVFRIVVQCPRKFRWHIEGLFKLIDQELRENSIYRGKAIDGADQFIDTSVVNPADVVYTETVQRRLEGDVWAFVKHAELLRQFGQDGKYAVLFEGPYGTGKSLAALLTAQIATAHGWTFLMCRPGVDDLTTTLEMARMYQPAVVFAEDVDTTAGAQSRASIERHLDLLDGIKQKGLKLVTIFTTNHAEQIHKGMLRPGRIGAVISIGAMDRPGVEALGRRVLGEVLSPDVDFDEVYKRTEGYMPAFIREVFDRAIRYAICLHDGELTEIDTEAICLAADGLRDQYRLMEEAPEDTLTTDLSHSLEAVVQRAVHGAEVVDYNDETQYTLAVNNGGR